MGLRESDLSWKTANLQQQQQNMDPSLLLNSISTSPRIVVIGLEFSSSSRDMRLLRWARRHLLQAADVVVIVSCWELAREPKYCRVPGNLLMWLLVLLLSLLLLVLVVHVLLPLFLFLHSGMILAATSAAGAYNRQQQQQVQQRMRELAQSALKGLHVYCLAVPISESPVVVAAAAA